MARRPRQTPEEAAAERAAAIRAIVDKAPPLTSEQIIHLSRIFAGEADLMRASAGYLTERMSA